MSANNEFNIIEVLSFAGFSSLGGLLSYLMRQHTSNQPIKLSRAVLEAVASGFTGVIAMFICYAISLPWYWAGAFVGITSWLGAEASIFVFARVVRSKIGLDLIPEKEKEKEDEQQKMQ
ncbi:hypothetical protein [Acinetobacter phage pB23]|nr:hypothetical protein [Acinetobacter phage pB23]